MGGRKKREPTAREQEQIKEIYAKVDSLTPEQALETFCDKLTRGDPVKSVILFIIMGATVAITQRKVLGGFVNFATQVIVAGLPKEQDKNMAGKES